MTAIRSVTSIHYEPMGGAQDDPMSRIRSMLEMPPAWQERGECSQRTDEGHHLYDPELWHDETRAGKDRALAMSICRICPVARECFDWAIRYRDDNGANNIPGVYGGVNFSANRAGKDERDRLVTRHKKFITERWRPIKEEPMKHIGVIDRPRPSAGMSEGAKIAHALLAADDGSAYELEATPGEVGTLRSQAREWLRRNRPGKSVTFIRVDVEASGAHSYIYNAVLHATGAKPQMGADA